MRPFPAFAILISALTVTACAGTPEVAARPPDYASIAGTPAPPQARLISDCVDDAIHREDFDRVSDPDTEMLRFVCKGAAARAFFAGLARRSAEAGSEFMHDGRTYRSTNPVRRNLFGVDYCVHDGGEDYRCAVNLNVGEFLRP